MAQLRYECSHCTKLSCNHAAATQHNRDAHGGQANILPERSKAQMRVNDFGQRAEIARLRADLANAGAVMVEAAKRAVREECWPEDGTYPPEQRDIEDAERGTVEVATWALDALSTLSPIAAAARVLLADPDTFDGFNGYILNRHDMDATMSDYAEGAMDYLRAIAEQEKADE